MKVHKSNFGHHVLNCEGTYNYCLMCWVILERTTMEMRYVRTGVLGLEKGTDCGPTTAEQWLSLPVMAKKKGDCSLIIL